MARTQTPPNLDNHPTVDFQLNAFEAAIWQKGYSVVLEEARQCPCRDRESGSPLSTCPNCRGIGWLFINPIKTQALVTSINRKGQFAEWSEESVGTISASFLYRDRLADYDRVTFLDSVSKKSEIYKVREYNGEKFIFLTYKPSQIIDVFTFDTSTTPLNLISPSYYEVSEENPYVLTFSGDISFVNNMVTVTYLHYPQYCVIDLPHDLRSSNIITNQGMTEKINLPVQAILRKVHIMFGVSDYGSVDTIDNSYKS